MKTYLHAWWRGIGVFGMYLCLSLVMAVFGLLGEALPERIQLPVTLPLVVLAVPPLLSWTFRWLYPDAADVTNRSSTPRLAP